MSVLNKKIKAGILYFPGTNCEQDLIHGLENVYGIKTELLWHTESFHTDHDIYFVPGGFSYGDYLRSGALAARSISIRSLKEAAIKNKMIVGICNGFQILTETGLLPGALIRNEKLKHICKWVDLNAVGKWSKQIEKPFKLPVSHSEGNYIAPADIIKQLIDEDRILMKYADNVNGSTENIAGITDAAGRIVGLMPHPERALEPTKDFTYTNNTPGKYFFDTLLKMI
ncbi:MAG: phosphoribosylformylglycinamidine synthase subunit PurQ [Spirochaetia bacterium]|nr:phosphoribosylformylglycinamidine synthase subunit PurQ [Spirochaetia bacterium]